MGGNGDFILFDLNKKIECWKKEGELIGWQSFSSGGQVSPGRTLKK